MLILLHIELSDRFVLLSAVSSSYKYFRCFHFSAKYQALILNNLFLGHYLLLEWELGSRIALIIFLDMWRDIYFSWHQRKLHFNSLQSVQMFPNISYNFLGKIFKNSIKPLTMRPHPNSFLIVIAVFRDLQMKCYSPWIVFRITTTLD